MCQAVCVRVGVLQGGTRLTLRVVRVVWCGCINAMQLYLLPELAKFDYYMRLDTDSTFATKLDRNIFEHMVRVHAPLGHTPLGLDNVMRWSVTRVLRHGVCWCGHRRIRPLFRFSAHG